MTLFDSIGHLIDGALPLPASILIALAFTRDQWMFAGPAAVFLFYLGAWLRIGPEPKPGTVVVRYDPPEGLSPAAARFIATGITDGRSLAAVIARLAVCGCIRIEPESGKYKLSQLLGSRAVEPTLAPEEKSVLKCLFEDGPVIQLSPAMDQHNSAQNSRYVAHIHQELTKSLGTKYFTRHSGVIALAVLLTFILALPFASAARPRDSVPAVFLTVWILFCGLMIGMMVELSFVSAWRNAMRTRTGWLKMLPGTAAITIFLAVIGLLLTKLAAAISPSFSWMLVAFLLIHFGWGPQLRRKTQLGRDLCDQIAGFRQFLAAVEQDHLNRLNLEGHSPQKQENLPYAIALEVKEVWGDQLSAAFFATTVMVEG